MPSLLEKLKAAKRSGNSRSSNNDRIAELGVQQRGASVEEGGGEEDEWFDDGASTYSTTSTLIDAPILTSSGLTDRFARGPSASAGAIQGSTTSSVPLPNDEIQCTIYASYEMHPPSSRSLSQFGFPSSYSRGTASHSASLSLFSSSALSKARKRLSVQLPLRYLDTRATADPRVFSELPMPKDGKEAAQRSGAITIGRALTVYQCSSSELTGVVTRPFVSRVLDVVYKGMGISSRFGVFPPVAVLHPGGTEKKSSKAIAKAKERTATTSQGGSGMPSVQVGMWWATLDCLSPPTGLSKPYPKDANKVTEDEISRGLAESERFSKLEPEEKFKHLFQPSQEDRKQMLDMLEFLERRGGIWTDCGRIAIPSTRCPDPKARPRYMVRGLFPEAFVHRCKHFRSKECEPMPSDLSQESINKWGHPLVTKTVSERLDEQDRRERQAVTGTVAGKRVSEEGDEEGEARQGGGGEERRAREDDGGWAQNDFFEGWSIGATFEPFRTGSAWESVAQRGVGGVVAAGGGF
ncbi:hypothetical protein IE53DRAFT_370059 [Violaceomyces palustris]|uniref:Uncharacterized protein n=1 Tax=Violaceomyces palustris TaxID=1673888 RepID=A0ACD0NTH1_9BASI|nr:hypothetical protein IE53DRAFT_370059 [Violaceomyces palustris]